MSVVQIRPWAPSLPLEGDQTRQADWLDTISGYVNGTAEYDAYGNWTAAVDPLVNRTEWDYDSTYLPVRRRNDGMSQSILPSLSGRSVFLCHINDRSQPIRISHSRYDCRIRFICGVYADETFDALSAYVVDFLVFGLGQIGSAVGIMVGLH